MSAWDNPEEMLTRAETARAQGEQDLAYQMYARASEINPQDANAWRGRAETSTNPDEALVSYGYANALAPNDQTLKHTLDASVAQRLGAATPTDVPLLVAMGQELAEVGLTEQAEHIFQRAVELDDSSADAWVWLAGVQSDKNKQTASLHRALENDPRDARARAGLLALKPPPPPTLPPATTAAAARPAAASVARSDQLAADSQAQADSSMERIRRLRETASQPAPQPTSPPQITPPRADNTMRYILIALLALVVILAFAGIFLLLTQ